MTPGDICDCHSLGDTLSGGARNAAQPPMVPRTAPRGHGPNVHSAEGERPSFKDFIDQCGVVRCFRPPGGRRLNDLTKVAHSQSGTPPPTLGRGPGTCAALYPSGGRKLSTPARARCHQQASQAA